MDQLNSSMIFFLIQKVILELGSIQLQKFVSIQYNYHKIPY